MAVDLSCRGGSAAVLDCHLLPSDLSPAGPEVFTVSWDLTLTAHTQKVLMRST